MILISILEPNGFSAGLAKLIMEIEFKSSAISISIFDYDRMEDGQQAPNRDLVCQQWQQNKVLHDV